MGNFNLQDFLLSMFVLIISLTVHELAHAKSAEAAGDDTARLAGRISINPLDHLDPVGTVMMIMSSIAGFGIGWAKPVPVNPFKLRHPRWDNLKVSLWGPVSNLIIAVIAGLVIRLGANHLVGFDYQAASYFVFINISLAIFNLIPIPPLDGSHILSALLPVEAARKFDIFAGRYGFMLLIGFVVVLPELGLDPLKYVLGTPVMQLSRLLTGA